MRVVHHGENSDDQEKHTVEIEMSIHSRCERIPPSISSPWVSSSMVGREQLIRIELTFASGLVKKAVPRLNATFFKSAAWYAASMSMVEGTSTQSKKPPSGIQTMVSSGKNFSISSLAVSRRCRFNVFRYVRCESRSVLCKNFRKATSHSVAECISCWHFSWANRSVLPPGMHAPTRIPGATVFEKLMT